MSHNSLEIEEFKRILTLQTLNQTNMSNQQQQDKKFADGFLFKRNPNAPDFVIGQMSVKVEEAINFLKANAKNGWVNMDIKRGRSGKEYVELSTYEPKQRDNNYQQSNNESPF